MPAAGIQPGKACKPILHVLASKEGASCQPSPKARAFRKNGYLARGLKASAISVPKNTAAAMPPGRGGQAARERADKPDFIHGAHHALTQGMSKARKGYGCARTGKIRQRAVHPDGAEQHPGDDIAHQNAGGVSRVRSTRSSPTAHSAPPTRKTFRYIQSTDMDLPPGFL